MSGQGKTVIYAKEEAKGTEKQKSTFQGSFFKFFEKEEIVLKKKEVNTSSIPVPKSWNI